MTPMQKFVAEQARPTILRLREHGFAVVIFTPEELDGANRYDIESALVEHGWRELDYWKQLQAEEEKESGA